MCVYIYNAYMNIILWKPGRQAGQGHTVHPIGILSFWTLSRGCPTIQWAYVLLNNVFCSRLHLVDLQDLKLPSPIIKNMVVDNISLSVCVYIYIIDMLVNIYFWYLNHYAIGGLGRSQLCQLCGPGWRASLKSSGVPHAKYTMVYFMDNHKLYGIIWFNMVNFNGISV